MPILRKALVLLTSKEQRRGGLVLGVVIVMAVLETAGFTSVDAFILALGAAAFGHILFFAYFGSLMHYAMICFTEMRRPQSPAYKGRGRIVPAMAEHSALLTNARESVNP